MALQTANQFQLSPDIGGAISQGVNTGRQLQQFSQAANAQDRQLQVREALAASQAGGPEGEAAKLKFQQQFPQEAQKFEADQLSLESAKFNAMNGKQQQRTKSNAILFDTLRNLPSDEARVAELQRSRERNAAAGLDNNETDFLLEKLSSNPNEANAVIDSGVKVAERLGILKPTTDGKAVSKIREETRGQIRKDLGGISKEVNVIRSNFKKLQNLAGEIRKGNRSAVPQALVAIVKLGDPGSIVSTNEMRGAINAEDPVAAIFSLLTSKGVNTDLAQSVANRIDPLNPKNINVDDLLSTGRATVSAFIPSLQDRFSTAEELANSNLTEDGKRSLFSEKLRASVTGLDEILGGKAADVDITDPKLSIEDLKKMRDELAK